LVGSFIFSFSIAPVPSLNNKLNGQPEWITDASGKITGYKTPGGADAVFPFFSNIALAKYITIANYGNNSYVIEKGISKVFIITVKQWYNGNPLDTITINGRTPAVIHNTTTPNLSHADYSNVKVYETIDVQEGDKIIYQISGSGGSVYSRCYIFTM